MHIHTLSLQPRDLTSTGGTYSVSSRSQRRQSCWETLCYGDENSRLREDFIEEMRTLSKLRCIYLHIYICTDKRENMNFIFSIADCARTSYFPPLISSMKSADPHLLYEVLGDPHFLYEVLREDLIEEMRTLSKLRCIYLHIYVYA